MSINMSDFVAFQSDMLRKNAERRAAKKPQIVCRHEREVGTVCLPRHEHDTCRVCAGEWIDNREDTSGS